MFVLLIYHATQLLQRMRQRLGSNMNGVPDILTEKNKVPNNVYVILSFRFFFKNGYLFAGIYIFISRRHHKEQVKTISRDGGVGRNLFHCVSFSSFESLYFTYLKVIDSEFRLWLSG